MKTLFATLDASERRHLLRKAGQLRDEAIKRAGRRRRDDDDAPARRTPVEPFLYQLLAEERAVADELIQRGRFDTGIVDWTGLGACDVLVGGQKWRCSLHQSLMRQELNQIAVGDEVDVITQGDQRFVVRIHPRCTVLSRRDPIGSGELITVANVDRIVVVVSIVAPPLHPRIIDRYLVAILHGGAEPVIFCNKVDLAQDEDERDAELSLLDPYRQSGIPIIVGSADSGEGIDALRHELAGRACAFVGHSGVGKSSLVNALCPEIAAQTGGVSAAYGRGAHTTTASSRYAIGGGTTLIDTPGIRAFALVDIEAADLARYFPEFRRFVDGCKFSDCTHTHEPRCGVKAAVERGELPEERYDSYLQLLDES